MTGISESFSKRGEQRASGLELKFFQMACSVTAKVELFSNVATTGTVIRVCKYALERKASGKKCFLEKAFASLRKCKTRFRCKGKRMLCFFSGM